MGWLSKKYLSGEVSQQEILILSWTISVIELKELMKPIINLSIINLYLSNKSVFLFS